MIFQPPKCSIMQITRKRVVKINPSYTLEGTVLDNVEKIKYHCITTTDDLKGTHLSAIFAHGPCSLLAVNNGRDGTNCIYNIYTYKIYIL